MFVACSQGATSKPGGIVATDWGPVVQTGIGAVAALGGGALGAWFQGRSQQRIERERRRERAAQTAAAVVELLHDLNPYREEWRYSKYSSKLGAIDLRRIEVRWELWVLAAGHPSKQVRSLARATVQPINDSYWASSAFIELMHEQVDEDALRAARDTAVDLHRAASLRADVLLEAIQRS